LVARHRHTPQFSEGNTQEEKGEPPKALLSRHVFLDCLPSEKI